MLGHSGILVSAVSMKMITTLVASAALAFTGSANAQRSGTMPDFTDATWFNTPPISAQDMEGHAVMVAVFRTW